MSNQEILSFTQNLEKSEQMRIYRNLYSHMAEEEKKGCQETYKRLVEKRDLYAYRLVSWNFNEFKVCGTCISIKRKNKNYEEHKNCYLI